VDHSIDKLPPELRVEAYILNVEKAIEKVKGKVSGEAGQLVELASAYVEDARYYLEKGDVFTALADVAYAEGLLDALRWLGLARFEWESSLRLALRPKVLVAGTFDILHPGHIELLRYAWERGRVYVVVARDESVEKFKGRPPIVPEEQRLRVVSAVRYVYKAMLGSKRDVLEPILAVKPDIIVLGPDQWADEEWLQRRLEERGLRVRIERFPERVSCPLCSSTSIICRAFKLGAEICSGERG
jgi:FAD synthetase